MLITITAASAMREARRLMVAARVVAVSALIVVLVQEL
jgi:hypothetical protein